MRSFLILFVVMCLALVGCGDSQETEAGPVDPTTADATDLDDVPPADADTDPASDAADGAANTDETTGSAAPTDGPGDDVTTSQPADGTPIPIEGEGDIGDGSGPQAPPTEPPLFGVSSETDSDAIPPYTSCWSGQDDAPRCIDGFPQPQTVTLSGSDQLVVTYAEGELGADASAPFDTSDDPTTARPEQSDLPVQLENPGIWLVDTSGLEPGDHAIGLSWFGVQGDAFTAFTLTIER